MKKIICIALLLVMLTCFAGCVEVDSNDKLVVTPSKVEVMRGETITLTPTINGETVSATLTLLATNGSDKLATLDDNKLTVSTLATVGKNITVTATVGELSTAVTLTVVETLIESIEVVNEEITKMEGETVVLASLFTTAPSYATEKLTFTVNGKQVTTDTVVATGETMVIVATSKLTSSTITIEPTPLVIVGVEFTNSNIASNALTVYSYNNEIQLFAELNAYYLVDGKPTFVTVEGAEITFTTAGSLLTIDGNIVTAVGNGSQTVTASCTYEGVVYNQSLTINSYKAPAQILMPDTLTNDSVNYCFSQQYSFTNFVPSYLKGELGSSSYSLLVSSEKGDSALFVVVDGQWVDFYNSNIATYDGSTLVITEQGEYSLQFASKSGDKIYSNGSLTANEVKSSKVDVTVNDAVDVSSEQELRYQFELANKDNKNDRIPLNINIVSDIFITERKQLASRTNVVINGNGFTIDYSAVPYGVTNDNELYLMRLNDNDNSGATTFAISDLHFNGGLTDSSAQGLADKINSFISDSTKHIDSDFVVKQQAGWFENLQFKYAMYLRVDSSSSQHGLVDLVNVSVENALNGIRFFNIGNTTNQTIDNLLLNNLFGEGILVNNSAVTIENSVFTGISLPLSVVKPSINSINGLTPLVKVGEDCHFVNPVSGSTLFLQMQIASQEGAGTIVNAMGGLTGIITTYCTFKENQLISRVDQLVASGNMTASQAVVAKENIKDSINSVLREVDGKLVANIISYTQHGEGIKFANGQVAVVDDEWYQGKDTTTKYLVFDLYKIVNELAPSIGGIGSLDLSALEGFNFILSNLQSHKLGADVLDEMLGKA